MRITGALLVLLPLLAFAQGDPDTARTYVLDPVTVTGTHLETLRSSVPNAGSVVRREDMRRSGETFVLAEINEAEKTTRALPDYTLLQARITVHPGAGLSVYLSGENLTDVPYQTMWDYPMPGRTFQAGVRWELR